MICLIILNMAFEKKRSCITQLLHVMEDFTKLIDDKKCIDVVYLDFTEAFVIQEN